MLPAPQPSSLPTASTDLDVRLSLTAALDDLPAELVESMRYLLTRSQGSDPALLPRRLGVTSALHGEGVTTVSRAFAAVLANDLDRTVCWIGLGQRRTASRRRKVVSSPRPGLFDVLARRAELDTVLEPTNDPRLFTCGSGTLGSSERQTLARGPEFAGLMTLLRQRFDHLVIDLPPLLTGSEGPTLLHTVDAYALVVRQGVTTSSQVQAALREARGVSSIGIVLNQCASKIPKRWAHLFAS